MFSTFRDAFKVKELRQRMLYMLGVLFIIRIGVHLPVPGVDVKALSDMGSNGTIYSLITGGNYGTIFAMGIGPFITASIIIQLLTVAIPKLEQLSKEGEEGRKKINQITRFVAVALAFLQGAGQIYSIKSAFTHANFWVYFVALVTMVTGTIFIMWLGEQLNEKGIGNGSSFIIFANILQGLKDGVMSLYVAGSGAGIMGIVKVIAILVIFVAVIYFVILVQDGERRIPVQYSKKMVGRKTYGGQSSYIPIKVNIAGVMSIIFAISLLQFPSTIYQIWQPTWLAKLKDFLDISSPTGAILYVILIFAFTFFYTSFSFNPIEVAENIKRSGGFVPGIRPGKPTSDYIQTVVDRISLIGACFYAVIALVPVILQWVFKIQVGFGGTTLLIVTGVALEIVKQLEAQMIVRHYKGFLG